MKPANFIFCALVLVAALTVPFAHSSTAVQSQDVSEEQTPPAARRGASEMLQVWLGGVDTDGDWSGTDPASNEAVTGDFGTLPYFGGGVQRLWGGAVRTGIEGGGLVTWKNDSTKFYGGNGSLLIDVDNSLFSIEVYMGGVLSIQPVRWLRIYAAAGPSLAYAYLDGDEDDPDSGNGQTTALASGNIEFGSGGNSFSLTLYGRGGIEFETAGGFTFGIAARYANHEFDFDDDGKLELSNVQYFLTLGQRL